MQPHPNWDLIEKHMANVPEFTALSSLATIYYDPNADTSYAQQNGCVVLNECIPKVSLPRLVYLTLHELQHIGLLHFERGKALKAFNSPRTAKIFNIAADLMVDDSIANSCGIDKSIQDLADAHYKDLENQLSELFAAINVRLPRLTTTEKTYEYLLYYINYAQSDEQAVLGMPTGNVQEGKSNEVPVTIRFPNMNPFNDSSIGNSDEAQAYHSMKKNMLSVQAWNRIYRHFKVTVGATKLIEGHLSQRMMLNRSVGGLRLMSRKLRVDGTHNGQHSASHSDAILFMDVSGSIEREQVDGLVAGIANQLQQSNLRGATLVTYNNSIVDIVTINRPSDVSSAKLRIGGGTNINRTLAAFKQNYSHVLETAKVAVVITDGDDSPVSTDIGIPILSVVFTPLTTYSKRFLDKSLGTSLHIPELI